MGQPLSHSYLVVTLRWLAAILLLCGIGAGVALFFTIQKSQENQLNIAFQREAEALGMSVLGRVSLFLRTAHTLSGALTLQPNLTRHEFGALVRLGTVLIDGIYGISWIARVPYAELPNFEKAAQAEWPGFKVYPSAVKSEYMVVYLIEPVAQNKAAIGFDLFSNPSRKQAMEQARDSGEAVVTSRIRLVQEKETQEVWGVLYTIPVYGTLEDPVNLTMADRRNLLIGYVNGVIRVKSLVKDSKDYASEEYVEWYVFDVNASKGDAAMQNQSLLYGSDLNPSTPIALPDDVPKSVIPLAYRTLDIGTRQWLLVMRPRPSLIQKYDRTMPIIWIVIVIVFTVLVCIGLWLLTARVRLKAQLRHEREKTYHLLSGSQPQLTSGDELGQTERHSDSGESDA